MGQGSYMQGNQQLPIPQQAPYSQQPAGLGKQPSINYDGLSGLMAAPQAIPTPPPNFTGLPNPVPPVGAVPPGLPGAPSAPPMMGMPTPPPPMPLQPPMMMPQPPVDTVMIEDTMVQQANPVQPQPLPPYNPFNNNGY
tara:strand:+ start:772 stop:1185 length:414 start_codon:yes stop_codon:yes gene_type:complete